MKRFHLFAPLLFACGCNSIGTAFVIEQTQAPTDPKMCNYMTNGMVAVGYMQFDAFSQSQFVVTLKVRNNLQAQTINFGNMMNPDNFVVPSEITPLRMDVAYECDTNGFAEDIGPLYLPQFSTTEPFCINRPTKSFVGRDVVLAYGAAVQGNGSEGLVSVNVIPPELGQAFADLFRLAQLSQKCCASTGGGCTDADLAAANQGMGSDCGNLQAAFDQITGVPKKLSATSSQDIQKFLPWGQFDANVVKPTMCSPVSGVACLPPTYSMRVRGILEGITGDGSTVSSTEWEDVVHICGHCGGSTVCSNPPNAP
jgi:hypothetical protein